MFLVTEEAVATNVPQTGSLFNSPLDCGSRARVGFGGVSVDWLAIREKPRPIRIKTCRTNTAATKTRKSRKTFRTMARPHTGPVYFFLVVPFFAGAVGFLYSVSIFPPSIASMP